MKYLMIFLVVVTTGCASKQDVATVPDFNVHAMTRSEVVNAINECESYEMKPFVEYLTQKTGYGKVLVPVNVHCNPTKKR